MKKIALLTVCFLSICYIYAAEDKEVTSWFVKTTGMGNGTSWDDALSPSGFVDKLSTEIDNGDILYIAAGVYYPGTSIESFFSIEKGITIIGGFAPDIAGNTVAISYPSDYQTIFSGDIDGNGKLDEGNSEKLFYIDTPSKVILKGITFTNANSRREDAGGCIDIRKGSNVELHHCNVEWNKSKNLTSGIGLLSAKLYCYKTTINNNSTDNNGAGIRLYSDASKKASTLVLESCLLANNHQSGDWGGAIQTSGSDEHKIYCANSTIANNVSGKGGAAINSQGYTYIVSSTIANNICADPSEGNDIRIASPDKTYIINSIVTGPDSLNANIYIAHPKQKFASSGYNIFGSVSGVPGYTYVSNATDISGKYFSETFGRNAFLSHYGGYPKTMAVVDEFAGADIQYLEKYKKTHRLTVDLTVDQRGFARSANTTRGAFEYSAKFLLNRIEALLKNLKNPASPYVFVIAHRTDWNKAPENSIAGIRNAIANGIDMVEIDIQKTKDGEFVVLHDHNLDRTTNGKGDVRDYTLEEIRQFNIKYRDGRLSDEPVPTLREALLACKDGVLVNIDKGGDYLDEIIPIILETDTEDHVVLKGGRDVASVRKMLGTHINLIYMPVVDLKNEKNNALIDDFLTDFQPVAVEVVFDTDDFPNLSYTKKIVEGGARVWMNALWASLCGGHEDHFAIEDPDGNWGWMMEHDATMIQSDKPIDLVKYIKLRRESSRVPFNK